MTSRETFHQQQDDEWMQYFVVLWNPHLNNAILFEHVDPNDVHNCEPPHTEFGNQNHFYSEMQQTTENFPHIIHSHTNFLVWHHWDLWINPPCPNLISKITHMLLLIPTDEISSLLCNILPAECLRVIALAGSGQEARNAHCIQGFSPPTCSPGLADTASKLRTTSLGQVRDPSEGPEVPSPTTTAGERRTPPTTTALTCLLLMFYLSIVVISGWKENY
jgi:hypothetical protein